MPAVRVWKLADAGRRFFSWSIFALFCVGLGLIAGCAVGPKYTKPVAQVPPSYKETGNWKPAEPGDSARKDNWWEIFKDPELNALENKLSVSNQTLRGAQDRFIEARAALKFSRAGEFPQVTAGGLASRQRSSSNRPLRGATSASNYSDFILSGDISYEADVWGRVRKTVESSRAEAQASAADLETVRLSLHADLALDYFTLRGLDAQKDLFDSTVAAFEKALELAQNRFQGGLASKEDVEQATTQLEQTRAQDIDITAARDQFEHAVAVLIGEPAFTFTSAPWAVLPPAIPPGQPSELLERRPDIAAAERRVEEANAQFGLAKIAYFPLITLNAIDGFGSGQFASWLAGPSALWSVGASTLETVFDAGRRRASSDQARGAYDGVVASYQKGVLRAFQ